MEKQLNEVTLINNIGCKIVASLSEQEIKQFESNGWKISEKENKTVVANLVRFGV